MPHPSMIAPMKRNVAWFAPSSGIKFTNVLWAAFACKDHKSAKKHWWLDCLFALLGCSCIKALSKYDGEIDPWSEKSLINKMGKTYGPQKRIYSLFNQHFLLDLVGKYCKINHLRMSLQQCNVVHCEKVYLGCSI